MANSFINKKVDLTTTDLTTLYTVPSFKSSVINHCWYQMIQDLVAILM